MERRTKLLSGSNHCAPNQLINIHNYVIQNHLDECEFVKVECSQKCGKTMPRYQLNGHFDLHCPRSVRTCSYCKVDFERQHMRVKSVVITIQLSISTCCCFRNTKVRVENVPSTVL